MPILTLKEQPAVPLEAESLSPDVTAGLALEAVRALPVYLGKRRRRVDDLFERGNPPWVVWNHKGAQATP
jgi:formylmethanofuran dehydrogenase subunit C